MSLSRRELFGVAAAAGVASAGCGRIARRFAGTPPSDVQLPQGDVRPIARFLNRCAFGPAPGDPAKVASMGISAYVDEQLLAKAPEDLELQVRLGRLDALNLDAMELSDLPEEAVVRQLQQAALLRAVYGKNQLLERMVDLWTNHFNIYSRKHYGAYYMAVDQLKVVREHSLGKFPDLVRASAHSPAMLNYLDNQVNRRGVPNENYARELMELHTLGVHGGYTQQDVREVARCLTGWTIETRFLRPKGRFRFDPDLHDNSGPKRVLGTTIPTVADPAAEVEWKGRRIPAGQIAGERVLDLVSTHPATAHFIATKLCRYFLGGEKREWVDRIAGIYEQTGGEIRSMLRPILASEELLVSPPIAKRPFDYVASGLRGLGAETDAGPAVLKHLDQMGQGLYEWPMPDGYPDKVSAWTGSLLARWNFAFEVVSQRLPGTLIDWDGYGGDSDPSDRAIERFLASHRKPNRGLYQRLNEHVKGLDREASLRETAALCLASPEFQWR